MARIVGAPAEPEAFCLMADQFHLRVDYSSRCAWMFRPVPYHNPPIRAHRCYYVGILRLVSGLVDFALVIDLLDDMEFDFRLRCLLRGSAAVSTDFFSFLIVVCRVRRDRLRKLYMSYLKIILSFTGGMSANQ